MALDRKAIAIGMLAGSGVMLIIAGVTVWRGVGRYFAGAALSDHAAMVFEGDIAGARRSAEEAAGWLGQDARAALPALDLTQPDSDQQLERLAVQVPANQRSLVATARNFARALRGEELTGVELMTGSDAKLVQHMAELTALTRAPLPPLPDADRWLPPSRSILRSTLEQRVATAWRLGDSSAVRRSAAALLALDPEHPAQTELQLAMAVLDPSGNSAQIAKQSNRLREADRVTALRGLVALLDADEDALGNSDREVRIAKLIEQIPAAQRSPSEMARWLGGGDRDLAQAAKDAAKDGSPAVVTAAINSCFEQERYDLVAELIPKLPADQQRPARLALAEYTWDTATLKELSDDPKAHLPRLVGTHLAFDHTAFHVTSASGAIPRRDLFVKVDGKPVHANDIRRFASLMRVPITPGSSEIMLEVTLDEQVLFSGKVRR